MKSICLNMLVNNDSNRILRALQSVAHLIDYWVICDTGSSDNTAELVEAFFREKGIAGELHHVEWKNYGFNRSQAIKLAGTRCDYLLFMDAHLELIDSGFDKRKLTSHHYMMQQRNGTLTYYTTRLVSTELGWKSIGVTHEYYEVPGINVASHKLEKLYVVDHSDSAALAEKIKRDIVLLNEGITAEPENDRYKFYLANSYRDSGDFTSAIVWYDRRISAGGWEEEVYYAKYMKMICQAQASCAFETWLYTGLDAFAYRPVRLEALYEIIKQCRRSGQHRLGYQLGRNQENVRVPADVLFVDRAIHEWKFLDELAVCAYFAGDNKTSLRITNMLLNNKKYPESEHSRLLANKALAVK